LMIGLGNNGKSMRYAGAFQRLVHDLLAQLQTSPRSASDTLAPSPMMM
jgi:hypothetical protein